MEVLMLVPSKARENWKDKIMRQNHDETGCNYKPQIW
jgi:hypothetical protein